ncbi:MULTISPECIES: replication initiation protein [Hymenobacter]|uniref:Initiator Replication protein n=1 Tax=Hymenobacter mucosus TaxID=1411120 RepID=A0A239BEK7_9BACT|nr:MULTISPECIES: replication initiation protein [Hymenobacter]MDF7815479.1 replication initiation protein [Hymenobacter sp. YC55]SNS05514.1 Initiator Replication protein [Hymenobacter mucosus]
MASKSVSPAPLPLGFAYEPQHKELVKQHWNATFSRQSKMSVAAKRIMARVLDQIKDDDYQLRPFYQLHINDIVEDTGIAKDVARRHTQAAIIELATAVWTFESLDKSEWRVRNLLDTTREETAGYKDGIITIPLNPALADYFINVAHYTTYQLTHYMKLKSWYSMRFFEILSAFKDTGFWEVPIDDYRLLMDCGPVLDKRRQPKKDKAGKVLMKYPLVKDLIQRTTTEPLQELADTDVAFTLTPVYEVNRTSAGRPKIVRLRFDLTHKLQTSIPASWLSNPETKALIERLRSWKVTDKNIALYAPVLGREGVKKILREWDLKAIHPTDRINSKEKYCNTALTRAAKQITDQQKAEALQVRQDLQLGLFAEKE